jgi:hypothetical protein
MCIVIDKTPATSAPPTPGCPAKALDPCRRQDLAVAALAGLRPVSALAAEHQVSRKFVYQQADHADGALRLAFGPDPADAAESPVLFYLPVTRAWLRQLVLALVLICHCSFRGVVELLADLFDYSLSLGTVHAIVHSAVDVAAGHNGGQDLSAVRVAALDEIFQAGRPVLVGCDADSTFCFLLSQEGHRDGDTWGVRLLEAVDRGLAPDAAIADGGKGLRAGHLQALPDVPCRADVFHALYEVGPLVRSLENRAYQAMAACHDLEAKLARPGKRRDQSKRSWLAKLRHARRAQARAVALADDVALLWKWLREDVLAVAGAGHAERLALYDFVVEQLRQRQPLCPHRIAPVCTLLANQRDDLLAFVGQLDGDLAAAAAEHGVSEVVAREVMRVEALPRYDVRRGPGEAALWRELGGRYHKLREAVARLLGRVVRASSVVENVNSRLRNYFFLRRQVGPEYLKLLQFFLNHRRFLRSERAERVGKSPAELLTGRPHPHWLEMLGHQRFRRAG